MFPQFPALMRRLHAGNVIIYPTETAYALGGDATCQKTVNLIFKLKKRPKNKSLPLIAGSLAMVKKYCRLSAAEERLARRYWPGPVTLILKIKRLKNSQIKLSKGVVGKDGAIAIRVSSHPLARLLSQKLGRPIVSTSANLSGKKECYSTKKIKKWINKLVNHKIIILDSGYLPERRPSTIVQVKKGEAEVLRQGEMKIKNNIKRDKLR